MIWQNNLFQILTKSKNKSVIDSNKIAQKYCTTTTSQHVENTYTKIMYDYSYINLYRIQVCVFLGAVLFIFYQVLIMNLNVDFSIGADIGQQSANADAYTNVTAHLQLHKKKIQENIVSLRNKLSKYKLPTIIFQFPKSAKDFYFPLLKQAKMYDQDEYYETQNNDNIYKCLIIGQKQLIMMKKKIQKVFNKLTELDNKGYVCMSFKNLDSFYDKVKQKKDYPTSILFEQCKIKAQLNLDSQFFEVFQSLVSKIAPKFADSPIMAIMPLLGDLDIQFQVDSLEDLQQPLKKQLFGFAKYEEPDQSQNMQQLKKDLENKDKVKVYINFDTLGYIQIELQVRMFAFFRTLVSI